MKINKIIYSALTCLFISTCGTNMAEAVSTVPYVLKGTNPDYAVSKESPPAYRIYDSKYFPNGTILYKQEYDDIIYYSPKPPPGSQEASGESKKYINWGFWDFPKNNNLDYGKFFGTYEHYSKGKITGSRSVSVDTLSNDGSSYLTGTHKIAPGTIINVLSITQENVNKYVYFSTEGTNIKSYNNVARVKARSVSNYSNDYKKIYFDESKNRGKCRIVFDNFKPYKNNNSGYERRQQLVPSTNAVPDGVTVKGLNSAKCNLSGLKGEWRFLGLNSRGGVIKNPYFPADHLSFHGNGSIAYYDWRYTPWTASDAVKGENKPSSSADSFVKLYDAPSIYDGSQGDNGFLSNEKIKILQKIIDMGYKPANVANAREWAKRLSLQTHPTEETPIFMGMRIGAGPSIDFPSRDFMLKYETRDLYVASMTIRDVNGNVVAQGQGNSNANSFKQTISSGKLNKGEDYTVEVVLGNSSNTPMKSRTLSADVGFVKGNTKNINLDMRLYDTQRLNSPIAMTDHGIIAKKGSLSKPFIYNLSVPENYEHAYLDVYGFVSANHSGIDNLKYDNDTGGLRLQFNNPPIIVDPPIDPPLPIDKEDIMAHSIELLGPDGSNDVVYKKDSSGRVSIQKAIIPGKSYKIRYTAKYTGEELWDYKWIEGYYYPVSVWVPGYTDSNGDWVEGHYTTEYRWSPGYYEKDKISEYSVPLEYKNTRKVGLAQNEDSIVQQGYFKTSGGSTSIPMRPGTYMYFETSNIMFEHPYLYTQFTVTSTNSRINSSTDNDTLFARLDDKFDIEIRNLRILPVTDYIDGSDKNFTYNIIYDAYLHTPSYVSKSDYQANVDTSIKVNNKVVTVIDQLVKGENKDITHSVSDVNISSSTSRVPAEVLLNFNKESYESGDYSNNNATTASNITKIKNPGDGNPSDKVSPPNNSNNSSNPNRGGDANNNCLVPRTKNTYTSTYNIHSWNSKPVTYTTFSGNRSITFNKYYTQSNSSKNASNYEEFEIVDVFFKSKYTKEKKLGKDGDGWISILNSNEKDSALIKAGYGFELKVITEYRSNALLNNPNWSASKTNGTSVSNLTSGTNLNPDIYVELPGDKQNRKILSVSGYEDTLKGLVVKEIKSGEVENGEHVYRWEYTIKPSKTVGISESGKVFIPQNLKDGKYKLSIYTPPITGVSSLSEYKTSKYSAMCDRKEVNVIVKGSATDDLNSHTTQ